MKRYLAVYTGSPEAMDAWKALDPDERQEREHAGMVAWVQWLQKHAGAIVEQGSPLGKTKQVSAKGINDVRNNMGAWTVVQAESQEAAARMFENHPHFAIFPGEAVDVMECLPLPQPAQA